MIYTFLHFKAIEKQYQLFSSPKYVPGKRFFTLQEHYVDRFLSYWSYFLKHCWILLIDCWQGCCICEIIHYTCVAIIMYLCLFYNIHCYIALLEITWMKIQNPPTIDNMTIWNICRANLSCEFLDLLKMKMYLLRIIRLLVTKQSKYIVNTINVWNGIPIWNIRKYFTKRADNVFLMSRNCGNSDINIWT